jgi:sarcosine oxidase subunit gamma
MADTALLPRSPLAGLRPGRHGRPDGAPGAVIEEPADVQIASLAARKGGAVVLAEAVQARFGLALPTAPRWVGDARLAFLWAGPEGWIAVAEGWPGALHQDLAGMAGEYGSVTAQGDGRVVLRLSGPRARDLLAKGVAIDLHPRVFTPGTTAITQFAHIGVQIRQLDETPRYELSAFRSYAGSLCHGLIAAGADYGVEVVLI